MAAHAFGVGLVLFAVTFAAHFTDEAIHAFDRLSLPAADIVNSAGKRLPSITGMASPKQVTLYVMRRQFSC
jgi:hypothetical protein